MTENRWTREQLTLAYYLYCQLPYGRLHSRNPEIIELAQLLGRTPSALAMKLVNFASLDPAITNTGRKGLSAASKLDRAVWAEFQQDWEAQIDTSVALKHQLMMDSKLSLSSTSPVPEAEHQSTDFSGETRQVMSAQRIKQGFFRRAVLSSYKGRCCMSGISEPRLRSTPDQPQRRPLHLDRRRHQAQARRAYVAQRIPRLRGQADQPTGEVHARKILHQPTPFGI